MSRKGYAPRRRGVSLSQHFLVDGAIADRIVARFDPQRDDAVLEIGPGRGVLTERVAGRVRRLVAVEIDRRLASSLRHRLGRRPGFEVVEGDAARLDLAALGEARPLRLLANLPYHISSPIVMALVDQAGRWSDALLMFQAEFAERLAARAGTPDYGSLSVLVQARIAVEPAFDVGPRAFDPVPRVRSRVVALRPLAAPLVTAAGAPALRRLLRAAFSARRKTLANALSAALRRPRDEIAATLAARGVDPASRAEEHPPATWVRLADDPRLAPAGTGEPSISID